jgi:cytochrome b involved in lipid metabolism
MIKHALYPAALTLVFLLLAVVYSTQHRLPTAMPAVEEVAAKVATSTQAAPEVVDSGIPVPAKNAYTRAELAAHADGKSCWTSINGGVYDLTNWVNSHPGGPAAILFLCGKDGTASFNAIHAGQSRPETTLASYKIGTITP